MSKVAGKILIIRGGAIGDFILTIPALSALRLQFPQARLVVLGYPHIVQLAIAGGLADQVTPIEARALAGFFARNGDLDETLEVYFASFQVILSYLYDPDEIFRSNVARCSKAQFIQGPHRPDENSHLHATEVFLQPLEKLAIFGADPMPRLGFDSCPIVVSNEMLTYQPSVKGNLNSRVTLPTIGIHPGSGSESKNWPEEMWAECLRALSSKGGWNFLLIGGEAEGNRLARLAAMVRNARVQIAENWPLTKLAITLRHCRVYVGHDSGISHLAAAVGLDGLVLWGSTNSAVWAPRSERMRILKCEQGLAKLSVASVLQELEPLLNRKLQSD